MNSEEARATGISFKKLLLKKQGFACCWCNQWLNARNATIEHIIPLALGGTNEFENYAVAHYDCNKARGHRMDVEPFNKPKFDFVRERIAAYKAGTLRNPGFVPRGEYRNDDGDVIGLW